MAEKLTKTAKLVLDRFKESETVVEGRKNNWKEWYKQYRAYQEITDADRDEDGNLLKSMLFIPYSTTQVETIVPRHLNALFSNSPYVAVLPREPSDIDGAKPMETLLDYDFQKCHLVRKYEDMVRTMYIYGTSIFKCSWKVEAGTRRYRRKLNPAERWIRFLQTGKYEEWVEESEEQILTDMPWLEALDLADCFPDPDYASIPEMRYFILRRWIDVDVLKARAKINPGRFKNLDKLEDMLGEGESNWSWDTMRMDRNDVSGAKAKKPGAAHAKTAMVYEYWEDDRVIWLAEEKLVIRDEPNPFYHGKKPFGAMRAIPLPGEFYGVGFMELLEALQDEMNTNRNQRIDNRSLIINAMFAYDPDKIDPADLVTRPNNLIPVEGGDIEKYLKQIIVADTTTPSLQEEQILEKNMNDVTGIHDYARGLAPQHAGERASTVAMLQNVANLRFQWVVQRSSEEGLEEIAEQFGLMNQQYLSQEQVIRIAGEDGSGWDFLTVAPEDIQGNFDYKFVGTALEAQASKDIQRQQLIEMYSAVVRGNPLFGIAGEHKFLERMLATFPDSYGIQSALRSLEEIQAEMQLIIPPQAPGISMANSGSEAAMMGAQTPITAEEGSGGTI